MQFFCWKDELILRITRMHSSRMCTTCCSGCLFCHACPAFPHHIDLPPCTPHHTCPLWHAPSCGTQVPLPCMPLPATHTPLSPECPPFATYTPLTTHTPCHACPHHGTHVPLPHTPTTLATLCEQNDRHM